jgi:thioester reductase-like protein/aryl carrier-like protein
LEQLYHEHGGANIFKQLDVLLFAGGPLPQVIGDEISKHTTLCQFYGSTEAGQIRQLVPLPEDWSYIQFHPNERFELQPAGEDMFELVLFADKDLERISHLYHNYPDVREWRTKDLFKPHPSKPDLWKFHARRDDILVFSSGEKLNPIPIESSITAFPGVSGALVVGQGHAQPALLVELSQNAAFSSDPRDLWAAIETANALLPGHGRIARSMIIITDPKKPLARTGKGTVVRRLTEELYTTEIRKLYEATSTKSQRAPILLKPSAFSIEDVKGLVRSILDQVSISDQLDDKDNFYVHGMDSVRTTEAAGLLKASLRPYKSEADLSWISGETLYRNPTIRQLSYIVLAFLNKGTVQKRRDRIAEMKAKIAEYTRDLPQTPTPRKTKSGTDKFSVAITGTTGYLGGRLLTLLTKNPRIPRIFCLNRSPAARQIFEKRNPGNTADVVFLHVNLASPNLGLRIEDYTRLLEECDIIVHNAWRVDFNLALGSFEDNLQSVKHLIYLSASSALRPRITFISSISSTGVSSLAGSPQQTVPEQIVEDLGLTMDLGYAESKHVAEHVLHAASQAGVPATILRVGQIVPSSSADDEEKWPEADSISVFLRTCKAFKLLALDFVDKVNWVPVDQAAAVVGDIVQHDALGGEEVEFYNVVHPHSKPWSAVMEVVRTWCGEGTQMVTMREWVQKLREQDTSDPKTLDRLPALRLLAFYDLIAKWGPTRKYEMENLMATSKCMRELAPVDGRLEVWLQQL